VLLKGKSIELSRHNDPAIRRKSIETLDPTYLGAPFERDGRC